MTEISYKKFADLESVASEAVTIVKPGDRLLNFFISAEIPSSSIREKPLKDVTEKAKKWRAEKNQKN
jgi:hypothetical protein